MLENAGSSDITETKKNSQQSTYHNHYYYLFILLLLLAINYINFKQKWSVSISIVISDILDYYFCSDYHFLH